MKLWQFFLLLAAIYLSPRIDADHALMLATFFTVSGLFFMIFRDWESKK